MPFDYEAIRKENQEHYGTHIGRIGPMLLVDRYDDRTHFIFELLQNAEDALSRRGSSQKPRSVKFELAPAQLSLSHFGKPFDEADVRGICGIAESTKDKFSIGRFGIGFKSVYTFTDHPEIHSGDEDFVVENYVWPHPAPRQDRALDETKIVLPFKAGDVNAQQEISEGFRRLGPGALLFLRHINDISWRVVGGATGVYLRDEPKELGHGVQLVTLIGQESGKPDFVEDWLVFQREVFSSDAATVGRVEVAFALQDNKDTSAQLALTPVSVSPLVVFFPTVVQTNLGFLVQGPYRTTPSRDNIPRNDPWNQHLVKETASLIIEAIRWIRDHAKLDTFALRCLPLVREKFPEGAAFTPVFEAVRKAFHEEEFLPRFDGGFMLASEARLARTQELRELFNPEQLAAVFGVERAAWLAAEITADREPEIRAYLMRELNVPEVIPAALLGRLTGEFLEAQADEWILRLYQFVAGQEAALRSRLGTIPLIRLTDGTHVAAQAFGKAQAFLPGEVETSFPTVRRAVCDTPEVRAFLQSLGIKEPDPVDDVIRNVLPTYQGDDVGVDGAQYTADIERVLAAFATDSKAQREKLLTELGRSRFVMVVDMADGTRYIAKPGEVYLASDRFKQMFAGVPGVLLVDDSYDCLRGEPTRELLEACSALRYPRPIEKPDALTEDERRELRKKSGNEYTSHLKDQVSDRELEGFDALIALLPTLSPEQRAERARLIWESLGDLEERRGRGVFDGSYSWTYYGAHKTPPFPTAFVRRLNKSPWIPDASGELVPPNLVVFNTLNWKTNPFLLSKIHFKPPILDQLAIEAGIEPEAIDLLRKLGLTSLTQLTSALRLLETPPDTRPTEPAVDLTIDARQDPNAGHDQGAPGEHVLPGHGGSGSPPDSPGGGTNGGFGAAGNWQPGGNGSSSGSHGGGHGGGHSGGRPSGGTPGTSSGSTGTRQFVSYIAVDADDEQTDPDGLDHAKRMAIEEQAYQFIIAQEPTLNRAPAGNAGFDLFETDASGTPIRWVEVKSMTGSLDHRAVAMSSVQFEFARQHGTASWLYVVEFATDPRKARILRIENPAGRKSYFTFDRGWSLAAEIVAAST